MDHVTPGGQSPPPGDDWISQRELAGMFGVTEQTASSWAKLGKLRLFEHGVGIGGRRRYSRTLVERELGRRWEQAVSLQDKEDRGQE
jgi:predicted site-specific integrase-resolvase